jgi:hypothetical protein
MAFNILHPTGRPALCGSTVSVVLGFNLHEVLGITGQIIGILAGAASLAWTVYSFIRARKDKG